MKADGEDVLRITLDASNAEFPILLGYDYHTSIVPSGWKDGDPVVGTGPYKLVEFQPGIRSVTTRNENYFKSDAAWVDTWIVQSVTDATAVTNGPEDRLDRHFGGRCAAGRFAGARSEDHHPSDGIQPALPVVVDVRQGTDE